MPLKPIFEKSPLKALEALPLRPGQVNVEMEEISALMRMAQDSRDIPERWEALLRLGMAEKKKIDQLPVSAWLEKALSAQREDGALEFDLAQSVQVMRAAFAMYEATVKRPILERMARWCGYLSEHWEEAVACDAVRQRPADLMELLENLYRVTGKKAMLSLMERLRRQGMDWSGVLHTFAVQRPMGRVTPWKDMEAGLEAENGSEQGFYTRQYLTCHGEMLADGARGAGMNGLYSGNGQELTAAKAGWEKISRYHGAMCGGLTCDETLAGTSPSAAVDAAALGAWAECFCAQGGLDESAWAFDALDVMMTNALARSLAGGKVHDLQRVNALSLDSGDAGCYHLHAAGEREKRAVTRLLRGYAAICGHAVTTSKNDVRVNLYLPGRYAAAMESGAVSVQAARQDGKFVLTLHMKQSARFTLKLRVPAWTADACVEVNQEGGHEGKPGQYLALERTWQDGDTVTADFARTLRMVDGHHQSVAVMRGPELLVMPVAEDGSWAFAACGTAQETENGDIVLLVSQVEDWRKRGAVPADLPVLPRVEGQPVQAVLRPYAEACGIALFPKGTQA